MNKNFKTYLKSAFKKDKKLKKEFESESRLLELQEEAKEEFDKKYDFSESKTLEYDNLIGIKDFINSLIEKAFEEGKKTDKDRGVVLGGFKVIESDLIEYGYCIVGTDRSERIGGLKLSEVYMPKMSEIEPDKLDFPSIDLSDYFKTLTK